MRTSPDVPTAIKQSSPPVQSKPALTIYKPPHLRSINTESNSTTSGTNDGNKCNVPMCIDTNEANNSNNIINSLGGNSATSTVEPSPKVRTPKVVYLPPHLRHTSPDNSSNIIENKQHKQNSVIDESSTIFENWQQSIHLNKKDDTNTNSMNVNNAAGVYNNNSKARDCNVDFPDEIKASKCSLIISSFPSELPNYSKEALLEPCYQYGGNIKWLIGNKVLVVFRDEHICKLAYAAMNNKSTNMLRVQTMEEYEYFNSISKMRNSEEINLLSSMGL